LITSSGSGYMLFRSSGRFGIATHE
jgi:hypothetical protein